ncbi:MAG: peptidase domain-containing ABC transporter [Bacteroidetes bacterium]|nr:peptidase domain-containing ABC transporter [Bacteroidota bacterium]
MERVILKSFVRQQDQSDCGAACLASIIKYHGGAVGNLDDLRKLSGTSTEGTTLLGLCQAAKHFGLEAVGLEAETFDDLNDLKEPAILHVLIAEKQQHYIVFYPGAVNQAIIGDPAEGVIKMNAEDLNKIWRSKVLLKLKPSENFIKKRDFQNLKTRWVFGLIRDDFNILILSMFLGIVISLLGVSTAVFSQRLIDDILPKGNGLKLALSLVTVGLLLLIRSCLAYLRGKFIIQQGMDFNNRIIRSFYSNLISLPKSFFDTRKTGDLIARMNDTRRIQSVITMVSSSIVIDFLMIAIFLGFVFLYSTLIGFIMLGALPSYFLILYIFNKPVLRTQKEVLIGYAMSESNFVDTIQGVTDIKLMNKGSFFQRINASIYSVFQSKVMNLGKLNIKIAFVSDVTAIIYMVTVFGVSSWLVLLKELKLGEMVGLLSVVGNVLPAVNRLVMANIQIQEAIVAFDRMFEFTSMKKEPEGGTNTFSSEKIEIQNISFRFPGRKEILQGITFGFGRGEIVALLGESGKGKSTLLHLIQKFYSPEAGKILVDNVDLQQIDTMRWRETIGCVPQDIKVFNGNLLFNITLSDDIEEHSHAMMFCAKNGFGKYFEEFPQGYMTLIGEEGINISGGQKQLVALVRALFRNPNILLLDEPTSAMDTSMESFVLEFLIKEKRRKSVLIVTHRKTVAEACDRVYFLGNGEIP